MARVYWLPVVVALVAAQPLCNAALPSYSVVDVSAITGQKVVGPVTSWQTPSGNVVCEHLAGINPSGDLIVFFWTPAANWKAVNVTLKTGLKVTGALTSWQNKASGVNIEHVAGRSAEGDLIVFYWMPGSDWKAVNVSKQTGQKIDAPPTSWVTAGWNHIAAQGPGNSLVQFYGTKPDAWTAANLTAATGQKVVGQLASWWQRLVDVNVECIAARSPNGDALVFHYTPGGGWKVANLTQMTGQKIGGPLNYWSAGNWNHLSAVSPNGSLIQFFGTVPAKWQAADITNIVKEKTSGLMSAYIGVRPKGDAVSNDEVIAARNPDGHLMLFWWSSKFDWQVMNVSQAAGRNILSNPEAWATVDKSSGKTVEHIAAQGDNNALLVFWGTSDSRKWTEAFYRPFGTLKWLRNSRGKAVVILWDPKRPDHPAPSRAAIEAVFSGNTNSIRSYFLENSGDYFTIDPVAFLPTGGGWYSAKQPANYYWQKLDGSQKVNTGWLHPHSEKYAEAILAADPSFNYAQYDTNRDGVLTANELRVCMIIPQNNPAGFVRDVFGSQSPNKPLIVDGVRIPELFECYIGSPPHMGLVAHEAAHSYLGTGDMYAQDAQGGYFQPYAPLDYSLMDYASGAHLDAPNKLKCGWVRPRVVFRSGRYRIPDVVQSRTVYILMNPKRGADEYFIIENRGGAGYDSKLPSRGLAVWHVIEKGYENLGTPPYTDPARWKTVSKTDWSRRAFRLIRPQMGPNTINLRTNALWRANVGYDLTSTDGNPQHGSLRWSNGTPSGFALRQISAPGAVMEVTIDVP